MTDQKVINYAITYGLGWAPLLLNVGLDIIVVAPYVSVLCIVVGFSLNRTQK